MAQLSEKLPAILKTTKEQRRFVPESEVERLLDEAAQRIKAESNELLSQQAASAHLLKYKAKKGRRLAAHLRLQNDRLKQAVEDEQLKFKQLKEALRRRTEQYDKLRLTHVDVEEKVKRLENRLKRQETKAAAAAASSYDHHQQHQHQQHPHHMLEHGTGPPESMRMLLPPTEHSLPVGANSQRGVDNPTEPDWTGPMAAMGRTPMQQRAKTPQGTSRPNARRATYKYRPSSAPMAGGDDPTDGSRDDYEDEQKQHEIDLPPASYGTTTFVESEDGTQQQLDSSGQEFTDEEQHTGDEDHRGGLRERGDLDSENMEEDFIEHQEEAYDHFPGPAQEMHSGTLMLNLNSDRQRSSQGGGSRPSSSPVRRSGGVPPLHGGRISAGKGEQRRNVSDDGTGENDKGQGDGDGDDDDRPSTAPDDIYRQRVESEGSRRADIQSKLEEGEEVDPEDVENAAIDQFLDEGDRLRPNSAPASPIKKQPSKRKTMFPKRQPKKRNNAAAAVEDARRLAEEKQAKEQMRMNSMKKTWLRAIDEEPLEGGIDKYAYTKKRRWVRLSVCQGVQCQGNAVRRHGCFGLTLIGALFFGALRSYGANKLYGYYNATAEFCVIFLGLLSYFGLYNVVVGDDTLRRLMTHAFHERRTRADSLKAEQQWRNYVVFFQVGGAVGACTYAGITALTAINGGLEGLDLFMFLLGTPALVWFTILTMHLLGLFWFSQTATVRYIKYHNPMGKKKDPDVENFFRVRRVVRTMSDTFGAHFVVPHTVVCLVGVAACVTGLASGTSPVVSFELLILGAFFSGLLYSMLLNGGLVTAATDLMFEERSMHTMELLKNFQSTFKSALLQLAGAGTNDVLCECTFIEYILVSRLVDLCVHCLTTHSIPPFFLLFLYFLLYFLLHFF